MNPQARRLYRLAYGFGLTRLLRAWRASHVPVLMYHGVSLKRVGGVVNGEKKHVFAGDFDRHLRFLKEHYEIIPLSRYAASLRDGTPLPGRCAVVTFDDGYENNHSVAFPLLKKHGVPATMFVTADFVERGEPLWVDRLVTAFATTQLKEWVDAASGTVYPLSNDVEKLDCCRALKARLKLLPPREHTELLQRLLKELAGVDGLPALFAPLKPEQVRALANSGLVEIGSHACRHLLLSTLSPEDARAEIASSRGRVAALSGKPVESFAYPNADHNPALITMVENAGYSCAVAEGQRLNLPGRTGRYALSRLSLNENDDEAAVASALCGLRRMGMNAAGRGRRGPA